MNHSVVFSLMKLIAMSSLALATLWVAASASASASAAATERATMQVCRADAQKLCTGVSPGGGRIAGCLRETESKLSPGCKAQLGKLEACAAEIKQLCPQAQGEGALHQCALAKRGEISDGCRAAVGE
jgi:hypothetical protein